MATTETPDTAVDYALHEAHQLGRAIALLDTARNAIYDAMKCSYDPAHRMLRPPLDEPDEIHRPFILSRRDTYELGGMLMGLRSVVDRLGEQMNVVAPPRAGGSRD